MAFDASFLSQVKLRYFAKVCLGGNLLRRVFGFGMGALGGTKEAGNATLLTTTQFLTLVTSGKCT